MRRAALMLVGGVAVFVACASSRGGEGPIAKAVDAAIDAVEDALGVDTSVSDAKATDAAPPMPTATPPTVDEVACNVERGSYVFAEKAYPGRTVNDLARYFSYVMCYPSELPAAGSGYRCTGNRGGLVRAGSVAVICGAKGSPMPTSVTFILETTP